ncbi:hypothetical protein C8J56DRAFT_1040376 [Mycena floridula]|nr:hypothetical protein C8J56DRAFT_1040376 [Mycena floridula]
MLDEMDERDRQMDFENAAMRQREKDREDRENEESREITKAIEMSLVSYRRERELRQPAFGIPGPSRPFQHGSSHSLPFSIPPARPFTLFPSHSRPYTPPAFPPVSSVAPVSPSRPRPSFDSLMGLLSARLGQWEVIELDDDGDISLVCHFNENGELVARSCRRFHRRILPLLIIPDPIPSSSASSPASSLPSSSSVASLFSEAGSTSSASSIDDQDTNQKTES